MAHQPVAFNRNILEQYSEFFEISLDKLIEEAIRTPKMSEKTKNQIKLCLRQGKIEFSYLKKIANYLKINVYNFFFKQFEEPSLLVNFKSKNPNIKLSIDDYYILRSYHELRKDIAGLAETEYTYSPEVSLQKDVMSVAAKYRKRFGYDDFFKSDSKRRLTETDVFKFLRSAVEDEGIYVFKNNKGEAGQRNGLSPFLYGCIFLGSDAEEHLPPLILLNSDFPVISQIATLLHEFAHYLLGEPEIEIFQKFDDGKVERWCNRFAYHFLVPPEAEKKSIFKPAYIKNLSENYQVSKASLMIRFKDLNLVSWSEYQDFFRKPFDSDAKTKHSKGSGGNYHTTKKERLSRRFVDVLKEQYYDRTISRSEFAKYLNLKLNQVDNYLN